MSGIASPRPAASSAAGSSASVRKADPAAPGSRLTQDRVAQARVAQPRHQPRHLRGCRVGRRRARPVGRGQPGRRPAPVQGPPAARGPAPAARRAARPAGRTRARARPHVGNEIGLVARRARVPSSTIRGGGPGGAEVAERSPARRAAGRVRAVQGSHPPCPWGPPRRRVPPRLPGRRRQRSACRTVRTRAASGRPKDGAAPSPRAPHHEQHRRYAHAGAAGRTPARPWATRDGRPRAPRSPRPRRSAAPVAGRSGR